MVNMLRHRRDGVNVNTAIFDMAFEKNVMTLDSQVVIFFKNIFSFSTSTQTNGTTK